MIDVKAETLAWWASETGTPLDSPEFEVAGHVLSEGYSVMLTRPQIARLGVELWKESPKAIGGQLSTGQALSLAKEAARAELCQPFQPEEAAAVAEKVRRKITAVQRLTEDELPHYGGSELPDWPSLHQKAAFAAIRQLGGARKVAIPEWMETAVGDTENWTACEHVMSYVKLACKNTAPGRWWCQVYHLGVITYELP